MRIENDDLQVRPCAFYFINMFDLLFHTTLKMNTLTPILYKFMKKRLSGISSDSLDYGGISTASNKQELFTPYSVWINNYLCL